MAAAMALTYAFVAVFVVWALSQTVTGLRRSGDKARTRDHGTLNLLIVVFVVSLTLAAWLAIRDDGQLVSRDPRIAWAGMALVILGLALRWWAIRLLQRAFTVDLAIHPGQRLLRVGPYRLVRNPMYAGSLLAIAGFAIGTGAWIPALVAFVPIALAFGYRIRVEERMLAGAFPDAWPAYVQATKRLIPFLW